mgnify:FL=1
MSSRKLRISIAWRISIFLLWLACIGPAHADHGALRQDTFNPLPDSTLPTFPTNSRTMWDHEQSQREGRTHAPFIYSGGLHGISSTLTSATFATEAFVPERVLQTSTAITYAAIANDVCWTIISSDNDGITGWTRVGSGSTGAYYYQCEGDTTPNQPTLPPNSAWLMGPITITASAIAAVQDKRDGSAYAARTGIINPTDNIYGATGDGTTDDYTAIITAIRRIPIGRQGVVAFPPSTWTGRPANYFLGTGLLWNDRSVTLLCGGASLHSSTNGTRITAAAGITPITMENGASAYGSFSGIENCHVRGVAAAPGTDDGIRIRANNGWARNVYVEGFGQYCFHVMSDAGGTIALNANSARLDNTTAGTCLTGGYHTSGVNSLAGTWTGIKALTNTGFGIYLLGGFQMISGLLCEGNTTGCIRLAAGFNKIDPVYSEIGGNTTCALQIDSGVANNVVYFNTASRSDGTSPICDNSGAFNMYSTPLGLNPHWNLLNIGNALGTGAHLALSRDSMQFNAGANTRWQNAETTRTWTGVVDASGNMNLTTTGSPPTSTGFNVERLRVGSGQSATGFLSGTASLNFDAWAGNDCQTRTIPVTGAQDGNPAYAGIPATLASVADVAWGNPWVSAVDTVSLRGCKVTAGASADPAAVTVRADVWQH